MLRVAIVGDGYTAIDLVRILSSHREVTVTAVTSAEHIGKRLDELYPHITGLAPIVLTKTEAKHLAEVADLVFIALPHGLSVPLVRELLAWNVRCIDLGADFRLKDAEKYKEHYHLEHKSPELLGEAVYGLPEIYRDKIRKARIVANPGCYPTAAILAVAPLAVNGLLKKEITVDAKSGVSGAGRSLALSSMFCEVNEGVKAYSVGTHRHAPEMEQEISLLAGQPVDVFFVPHLIPMSRGILATVYAFSENKVREEDIRALYEEFYRDEPFVKILPRGIFPHTKWTYGSNHVYLGMTVEERSQKIVVVSAIDNLVKGASGQAVQNMNIMTGIKETEGLDYLGVFP